MISKINYKKIIIISTIFIGLFFLLFYFSHNTVSEENNQQTNANDTEMFKSVSVEPNKIKVGETQITRVEIDSKEGIEKVFAQIPFEGGYDEVALKLIEGDKYVGVWEGKWVAHNTLSKQYETKISVVVSSGEIKTINATWWDDTETTWFDQNWIQRKKVTVTENSGTDLTDYQVPIDLTTGIYDNTGLVGSWHFSEGSGTFVADSSGQGNNGTIYNGEIWAANNKGESNSALNFDGSGNYIKIENSNSSNHSLDLLQNFTFISWIKPASLSTYNAIIAKRNGGSYQYELRLDSGYISLLTSSGVIKSDLLVDTGRWHFIAAVRDVVSGITTIFLDGHSYSAANLGISYCNTNVTMGKNADGTHIFNGSVDEVRIYNRALSAEEIGQLYGEGKARLDLNDLRFTAADGKTQLSYWLENDSKAWVKVPTLSASADTNIYYYFGNPVAASVSNGDNTFKFFEDFESDLSKWIQTATSSTSILQITASKAYGGTHSVEVYQTIDNGDTIIQKALASSSAGILEWKFYDNPSVDGGHGIGTSNFIAGLDGSSYYSSRINSNPWVESTVLRTTGWHSFKMIFSGTDTKVYVDNNLIQTTSSITSCPDIVVKNIWGGSGQGLYQDNFVFREYVSSEPTIAVSIQEEKRPTDAGTSGVSGGGPLAF